MSITLLNKSNITSTKTSVKHIDLSILKPGSIIFFKKSQFWYCSYSHSLVSVLFKLSHPDKVDFQWRLHLKSFSAKITKQENVVSCRLVRFKLAKILKKKFKKFF